MLVVYELFNEQAHVDPRFARSITALTAKDVTTIPMRLVEAQYDLVKVSNRLETIFNYIPPSISSSKKGPVRKIVTKVITKLTKIQIKNARKKAMRKSDPAETKKMRGNFAMDATSLYWLSVNENIQKIRAPVTFADVEPRIKRQKIDA